MTVDTFSGDLSEYLKKLKQLRVAIGKDRTKNGQLNKTELRTTAEVLAQRWFDEIKPKLLDTYAFQEEDLVEYDGAFTHLIKISSSSGNKRQLYLKDLSSVASHFHDKIILRIRTKKSSAKKEPTEQVLRGILSEITDPKQNTYLKEAIDCATAGYLRGAVVLGWCAAVYRIHKAIEKIGFDKFNIASAQMASAQIGRFKRFNKVFNIGSLSELGEVFDNDILWVLEGMGLIDMNQHTRLKACFDMRNNAAHPGEAPTTPYNVMSFFSDLNEIIFKNPRFN